MRIFPTNKGQRHFLGITDRGGADRCTKQPFYNRPVQGMSGGNAGERIPTSSGVTLRDYQEEASRAIITAINEGKCNGLIVMPTGTGKTVTFVETAKRIYDSQLLGAGKKVLVLVHRVELVDQAAKSFEKIFGKGSVSIVSAGRQKSEFQGPVVVAGVQTLVSPKNLSKLLPAEYGLIITDETHHIIANTWRKILEHLGVINNVGFGLKGTGKFLLGVTATPDRADNQHLSIVFSDGLLFSKPLAWFVKRGYLLHPAGVLVTTQADLSKVRINSFGDYDEASLAVEMSANVVLHQIVKAYEDVAPGKRALVFAANVEHARRLTDKFNEGLAQPRAATITGDLDPQVRADLLAKHRRGEIAILINFGVLTEGYDDPGIEVVMLARPTRFRGLYVQMVGRGLRPDPAHPEAKSATIIDITGIITTHELNMDLARLFGVEYSGVGLPPTDVIALSDQFSEMQRDPKIRERLKSDSIPDDMDYLHFSLMREQINPLSSLFREILSLRYEDNFSRMAWEIGISESKLTDYIIGNFPAREFQVRNELAACQAVLGKSLEEIVQLWRDSQDDLRFTALLNCAVALDRSEPDLSLPDFMAHLALSWQRNSNTADPLKLLRFRLSEWERTGFNLEQLELILDKHDRSEYKRRMVKADLAVLVANALEKGFNNGKELLANARQFGELLSPMPEMSYQEFLELASEKGIDTRELTSIIRRNHLVKRPIQTFATGYLEHPQLFYDLLMEFASQAPAARGDAAQFIKARTGLHESYFPSVLTKYLVSSQPEANRKNMLTIIKELAVVPMRTRGLFREPVSIFAKTGREHLLETLRSAGMISPEESTQLFEDQYFTHLFNLVESKILREVNIEAKSLPPRGQLWEWVARQLGTTVVRLQSSFEEFSRPDFMAKSKESLEEEVGSVIRALLIRTCEEEKPLAAKAGRAVFRQDVIEKAAAAVGLTPAEIKEWITAFPNNDFTFLNILQLRSTVPTTEAEKWLLAVNKGRDSWSRSDSQGARQKKIIKALTDAGFDINTVLKRIDSSTETVAEKTLAAILFNKERANFKRPAKS